MTFYIRRKCIYCFFYCVEFLDFIHRNNRKYYPDVCEERETPEFSDTLRIGCYLVVQKIFKDLQIEDVLLSIFGDLGLFIEDIVSYISTNENCTFQYYSNFMRNHPVMDKNIRDDTQISRLLKYNIKEEDINLFLRVMESDEQYKRVYLCWV